MLAIVACTLLLGLAALGWLVVVFPDTRPTRAGRVTALQIETSTTIDDVAQALGRAQLIDQPSLFSLYARVLGANKLREGRVLVSDAMNVRQLLARVALGLGQTELRITIPEGWNRFEIADRLNEWGVCEREPFLGAPRDAEGFLFRDTYLLLDRSRPEDIAAKLSATARERLAKLTRDEAEALARLRAELGFELRDVVTLASIVEKEARAKDEQAIIAGVFLNRLRDPAFSPKRLQADPTTAYGCVVNPALESCEGFDGRRVTRRMTSDAQNAYNTYRIERLPPGPIANPGLSALRAVLRPAQHDYFYFVARGDGRHEFSRDLATHNTAVQQSRGR